MEKHKGSIYKVIIENSRGYVKYILLAAIFITVRVFTNFLTPQIIRFTVDYIIDDIAFVQNSLVGNIISIFGGREYLRQNIWIIAIFVVMVGLITFVLDYTCRISMTKGTEGIIKNIRDSIFNKVQKLPYSWHLKNQTGDIIQRATSDVEVLRHFMSLQISEMFRTINLVIISISLLFSMNYRLSIIVTIFIPVVILYSSVFYGMLSKKFLLADEAEGDLFTSAQENYTGVRVVRAFGRQRYEIDKFNSKNENFSNLWVRLGYVLGYYWGIGDMVTGILLMSIVVMGSIFAVNNIITLGEFLVFISYTSMITWPLRSFGRILGEMSKTKVSLERINEILGEDEEIDKGDLTPPMNQDIEFRNVSFKYDNNLPVIKDVSFKIKAGSTFAILGGTGSGKTTLMHLLNRLYELEDGRGSILIGDVDIKNIKFDYLRKNIGMVLQEPFLFSRSIKDNITIVNNQVDEDSLNKVSAISQLQETIKNFSKGYETIVGERGVTLSGGQKQRVAIARMLMQKSSIMVFDDSLSQVDSETDNKIRAALKESTNKSTTILISHRITTLMEADTILVLDKGRVSDIGTHDELIAREGIYKNIYEIQMNILDDI